MNNKVLQFTSEQPLAPQHMRPAPVVITQVAPSLAETAIAETPDEVYLYALGARYMSVLGGAEFDRVFRHNRAAGTS